MTKNRNLLKEFVPYNSIARVKVFFKWQYKNIR